jgi:NAD(P)-dependent dehydrogenase (short-subunit alcohol dehydrogenase family)
MIGGMKKLENKTVFITGGLSGIGKACAVAAAAAGANVVVGDIKSVAFDAAMEEIKSENDKSIFIECDVASTDQIKGALATAVETFGSVDIALNNAGVAGEPKRIGEMSEDEWNYSIHVNLTGIFNCMKYELLQMVEQKSGVIVNMSSVLGLVGFANSSAYVAAKHGIIGLTKTAALEYAPECIRVNVICPGFIDTPMLTKEGINEDEKTKQRIIGLHPLNRLGTPKEIAKAFIFLASDDSSFITGTCLEVDGGYLAQ